MQENYLAKWLNGELTEAELLEFKKSSEYETYLRIAETSQKLEAPIYDEDKAFEALKNRQLLEEPKVVKLQPFKAFLRVAAVAALIMIGAFFYLQTLDDSISTGVAENKEIRLPDNSEVTLNADSQITYDEGNWQEERDLKLNGEAFFKVAKGERFTVHTEQGKVSVLGTQFNIKQRSKLFIVDCFEGLVQVDFDGKTKKLSKGMSLSLIDGQLLESDNLEHLKPAWLAKESSFKSVPLKYVFEEFGRQYNMEVTTRNVDTQKLFTGTFSNTHKELALKSISVPSQIKFKLEGGKVLFYGE